MAAHMDGSSGTPAPYTRRLLACFLAALTALQPAIVSAGSIVPAIGAGGPAMDAAGNGVPVVNIVAPDASGLSHNRYRAFSVDNAGAILNNSAMPAPTQLGGYIEANPNLGNGTARLILNEVTGDARSTLGGYLEVAGTPAEVVVANPHGITCNGCGFINTPRAMLTTGVPLLDGGLAGYRVTGGDITVLGAGVNTDNVDVFTLLSRAVQVQAGIYADDLRVGTGAGDFDIDGNLVSHATTDAGAPAFAIDSTALGGIHANRIRLVATEDGVGVRIAAPVAAQTGDLILAVNGTLANRGLLMAEDLHVSASEAIVNGEADAAEPGVIIATRMDIDTPLLDNRYGILRTQSASGVLLDDGIGLLDNRGGTLWLGGDDQVLGTNIDNRGGLILHDGAGTLHVESSGDLMNDGGEIGSSSDLVLKVGGALHNDAGLLHGGRLLHLWLPELAALPEGTLSAGDWLHLQSDGAIRLTGTEYVASGNLRLTAATEISLVDSLVGADQRLALSADTLSVAADAGVFAGDSLAASVTGDIANDGLLFAANDLSLDANGLIRNGSDHAAASIVSINGDITLFADGGLYNNGSLIDAMAGDLVLGSPDRPIPVVENSRVGLVIGAQTRTEYGWTSRAGNDRRFPDDDWWLAHCYYRSGYCGDPYEVDAAVAERNAAIETENLQRMANGLEPLPLVDYRSFDPADYAGVTAYLEDALAVKEPGQGGLIGFNPAAYVYSANHENRRFIRNTDNYVTGALVDAGRHAGMLAGGDITASVDDLTNTDSLISAAGNLVIDAHGTVRNVSTSVTETLQRIWNARGYYCNSEGSCYRFNIVPEGYQPEETSTTTISAIPSVIAAGGQLVISSGAVENVGTYTDIGWQPSGLFPGSWPDSNPVAPTAPPDLYALPTNNPLFVIRDNPDHRYLVETNPLLATYAGFLGSDYLLERLGLDPDGVTRRLGDGFYEMTLVREQLLALAGSRLLPQDFTDEQAQYTWLLENGVYAAQELQLSVGIALTPEQANALTADLVWLEERQVAGYTVLAPVVYLAPGSARLTAAGAVVAGGDVLVQAGSLRNDQEMQADHALLVKADEDIVNTAGMMVAGDALVLAAKGDIENRSGVLHSDGDMLLASSTGSVVLETATSTSTNRFARGETQDTVVGARAVASASGTMVVQAANDIGLHGASIAAGAVGMQAGRNVVVDSVALTADGTWRGGDHVDRTVRQLGSTVSSLTNLMVEAGQDIGLMSSALSASDDVRLVAGEDIAVLAGGEQTYAYRHSDKKNTVGSSSSTIESSHSGLASSSVRAGGNVSMDAGRDIAIFASGVTAEGDVAVVAARDVQIVAGVEQAYLRQEASREGATRYSNSQSGYLTQGLVEAGLSAGGSASIDAQGNVALTGASILANKAVRIGATTLPATGDGAVAIGGDDGSLAAMRSIDNVTVESVTLVNEAWSHTESGYKGPVRDLISALSLSGAWAASVFAPGMVQMPAIDIYAAETTHERRVDNAGSLVLAEELSIAASGTVRLANADILVGGTASVVAGDIAIDAVADTREYEHETVNGTVQGLGYEASGDSITIMGVKSTDATFTTVQRETVWNGTSLSAGELVLKADAALSVMSSDLQVLGYALLAAGESVEVGGYQDAREIHQQEQVVSTTVSVGLRNAYVDAVNAVRAVEQARDALDDATEALADAEGKVSSGDHDPGVLDDYRANVAAAAANLGQATIAAASSLASAVPTAMLSAGTGMYATAGTSHEVSNSSNSLIEKQWSGSSISAGGDVDVVADENIDVVGASVSVAGNLTTRAAEISISAGQSILEEAQSRDSNYGTASLNISGRGVTGSASVGTSTYDSQSSAVMQVNTTITAGGYTSRSDELVVSGARIEARDVDIETGRLVISSVADTSTMRSTSTDISLGAGASIGASTASLHSVSGGVGNTTSSQDGSWVSQQTWILGSDSVRVRAGATTLAGAVVANASVDESGTLVDHGGLDFETGTLDAIDISGKVDSATRGYGLDTALSTDAFRKSPGQTATGQTTIGLQSQGHIQEQLNRATLGLGAVTIGGSQADGVELNRDLALAQTVMRDEETAALNAQITVDNRWASGDGLRSMAGELASADNNAIALLGLGAATTASAVGAVAAQVGDPDVEALDLVAGPSKLSMLAAQRPDLAAAIYAYERGSFGGLVITQEGLQAIADALGVDVDVVMTSMIGGLGLRGTTDQELAAIDVAEEHRDATIVTLGHELAHNQGVSSHAVATLLGWSLSMGHEAGVQANHQAVMAEAGRLSSEDRVRLATENMVLLAANNLRLEGAMEDHPERFEDFLSADQNRQYMAERAACATDFCRISVDGRWVLTSRVQDVYIGQGAVIGVAVSVKDDVEGMAQLVLSPGEAIAAITTMLSDPDAVRAMGQSVYNELQDKVDEIRRLAEHGQTQADMTGLGANISQLMYVAASYLALGKGVITAGANAAAIAANAASAAATAGRRQLDDVAVEAASTASKADTARTVPARVAAQADEVVADESVPPTAAVADDIADVANAATEAETFDDLFAWVRFAESEEYLLPWVAADDAGEVWAEALGGTPKGQLLSPTMGNYVANSSAQEALAYDISSWAGYGLPADGYFARAVRQGDVQALVAGAPIDIAGRAVAPFQDIATRTLVEYPDGTGFVSSAEDLRAYGSGKAMKQELDLNYEPEYILEFQIRDSSRLQNILFFDDPLFVGRGRTLHGKPEWNVLGLNSNDLVNWRVRKLDN